MSKRPTPPGPALRRQLLACDEALANARQRVGYACSSLEVRPEEARRQLDAAVLALRCARDALRVIYDGRVDAEVREGRALRAA